MQNESSSAALGQTIVPWTQLLIPERARQRGATVPATDRSALRQEVAAVLADRSRESLAWVALALSALAGLILSLI